MGNSTVPGNPCYHIGGAKPSLNCIPEPPFNQQVFYTTLAVIAAWCIVVALTFIASRGIRNAKSIYSTRMQRGLLLYIAFMALFSTGALVQNIIFTQNLLFSMYDYPGAILGTMIYDSISITLPFAASGADWLMVWRCWVLYQGVHRRWIRISVCCLLVFLLLCSLASAVVTIVLADANFAPATPLLAVTITINLILSALIVSRLLYHERSLRKTMGVKEKMSPVMHVIAMCVESCALIVVFAVLSLGMEWSVSDTVWNLSVIPVTLLPHVCVISPFLIIIRVASGRAPSATVLPSPSDSDTESQATKHNSLRFKRPDSMYKNATKALV